MRQEVIDFFSSVDFNPLVQEINKRLRETVQNYKDIDFTFHLKEGRNGRAIVDMSEHDLLPFCGVFSSVLSEAELSTFSTEVSYKDQEQFVWITISLTYKHRDGGANGMNFLDGIFRKGEWTFRK
jgi:hypothetical protein